MFDFTTKTTSPEEEMKENSVARITRKPISPIPKRKDPNRRKLGINLGEKNGMWKGDNVGYLSLHASNTTYQTQNYVKYEKKVPAYDLANISGEYKRDLNDWQLLCRKCHMLSDGRLHSRDDKTGKFIPNQQKEIVVSSQ